MTSVLRPWLLPALATAALVGAPSSALAADGDTVSWNLPFQRLGVGANVGGMGLAGANVSLGFDPYSQVELEVGARMFTGSLEKQDETGAPDFDPACETEEVYPCTANAAMISLGIVLGKHNTWEKFNPGVAVRTGMSTLGEVYTSVGPRIEGALSDGRTLTWNAELSAGYWFTNARRAPSDLLALAWDGVDGSALDSISQNLLLSIRLGIEFYPVR